VSCGANDALARRWATQKLTIAASGAVGVVAAILTIRKHISPLRIVCGDNECSSQSYVYVYDQEICLFASACLGLSLCLLAETVAVWKNRFTCQGNSKFLKDDPVCVGRGSLQWWFLYVAVGLGLLQAVQVWASATHLVKLGAAKKIWKIGVGSILVCVCALTASALGVGRMSYEPDSGFPFCMVRHSCAWRCL
jgi:hypothetical protein